MLWYFRVIKKYATFKGRARRKEYWFFFLFNTIITLVLYEVFDQVILRNSFGIGLILYWLYTLFMLLPGLGVGVRRMHDVGKSGWWLIVPIANLVFLLKDSDPYENNYGPNPNDAEPAFSQPMRVWKMRFIVMGIAWLATILIQMITYRHIPYLVDMPVIIFSLVIFELLYRTRAWLNPITGVIYLLIIFVTQPYILNLIWYVLYDIKSILETFQINLIEWYRRPDNAFAQILWIILPIVITLSAYLLVRKLKEGKETNQEPQQGP